MDLRNFKKKKKKKKATISRCCTKNTLERYMTFFFLKM